MNATVRQRPACAEASSASVPSGLMIAVEVRNTMIASGTRMMRDRLELAPQVGGGALLDRLGDLLHLRRALVLRQDVLGEAEADDDGDERGRGGAEQHCPLAAAELEDLIAAFGSNEC